MIEKIHPSDLLRSDKQGKEGMVFDPLLAKINELCELVNYLLAKDQVITDAVNRLEKICLKR